MDLGINQIFLQLKPVCDSIAESPTKENLIKLQKIITNSPLNVIQQLHEYIIFPLYVQLENGKSAPNVLKQDLLETLKYLVEKIKLNKLKVFTQLCATISKQIFDKKSSTLIETVDEETKLAAVQCILFCYKNLPSNILIDLYTKNNSIYFSQCIYLCVQLAKNEKMRNLKITALNCLLTISYIHDESDFSDKVLRQQVADCIMYYLPGISTALRDIAIDDEKQGHKITALAAKALNRFIVLHMEDDISNAEEITIQFPLKEIDNTEVEVKSKAKNIEDMIKKIQNASRSKEWYKMTAQNLFKIIESLSPLQYHGHEKVRYELSDLTKQILTLCPRNLGNSWCLCVEILICLSEDEISEVSNISRQTLKLIDNNPIFFDILSQNFYDVITKLPRIMNGTETQKQLSILNLLVGYLRILAPNNLSNILQSSNHLNRLLQSLIFVAQMEKSNITLFEEHTIRNFEAITETPVTWKYFKFLHEKILVDKFLNALQIISQSDASQIIVDYLCEIFLNESDNRNEIIFLLNQIISVEVEDMEQRMKLIDNIIKMYIDEETWYLPTDVHLNEVSILQAHTNIIQMCLLVEGLGCISNGIGIDFKKYLLKTLYLVLERAGMAQPLLSTAGLLTLLEISKACQYENVTDLIVQNTDYFSFHVTRRLKKLDLNTGVLNVLNVIMDYSTIEVLPSIMNIVNEVLLNSCDRFQEHNITSFLRVFYSFVKNLKRWMDINIYDENHIIKLLNEYKKTMDVLYAMYDDRFELSDDDDEGKSAKEMYEEDLSKNKEEFENENEPSLESKKPEPPEHIKLTVSVLKRSLNFLPSKNRDRKILTLNILREGIEIISSWQDELLPVVHLIWSPLIDRFKEHDEPLIINRSFELLMTLARFSKDFIRIRTCKNVLPELCATLKRTAEKSYLKDRGSAYRYTQEYKLQLIVLQNLAQILNDLEVADEYVHLACTSIYPYLSIKQPIPLQENAIEFYKRVAIYDFDTIWLYLLENHGESKDEFRKNNEIILKCLEVIHW